MSLYMIVICATKHPERRDEMPNIIHWGSVSIGNETEVGDRWIPGLDSSGVCQVE